MEKHDAVLDSEGRCTFYTQDRAVGVVSCGAPLHHEVHGWEMEPDPAATFGAGDDRIDHGGFSRMTQRRQEKLNRFRDTDLRDPRAFGVDLDAIKAVARQEALNAAVGRVRRMFTGALGQPVIDGLVQIIEGGGVVPRAEDNRVDKAMLKKTHIVVSRYVARLGAKPRVHVYGPFQKKEAMLLRVRLIEAATRANVYDLEAYAIEPTTDQNSGF